ncbi:unnamed protein product, partial [Symbiodinium sp. KB8]
LAAFLHSHPEKSLRQIVVQPTITGPVSLVGSLLMITSILLEHVVGSSSSILEFAESPLSSVLALCIYIVISSGLAVPSASTTETWTCWGSSSAVSTSTAQSLSSPSAVRGEGGFSRAAHHSGPFLLAHGEARSSCLPLLGGSLYGQPGAEIDKRGSQQDSI